MENYPRTIKNVLQKDILTRKADDEIRIAYELAAEIHQDSSRKGVDSVDYITHPVRVYDLVNRCTSAHTANRKEMLVASLLHDVVEDYLPPNMKDGYPVRSRENIRAEAIEKIRTKFPDEKFAETVIALLNEVTNPIDFRNKSGEIISKKDWQIAHIQNMSLSARVIKICDQTANLISDLEELPNMQLQEIRNYQEKAKEVVAAATNNLPESDGTHLSLKYATRFFDIVYQLCETFLDTVNGVDAGGKPFLRAHVNIDSLNANIEKIFERDSRFNLSRNDSGIRSL